jgi:hypothetical protein
VRPSVLELVVAGRRIGGLRAGRRRRSHQSIRTADFAVLAHRCRALAAPEEVRDEEVAVGVTVPKLAVRVAVADLTQLGGYVDRNKGRRVRSGAERGDEGGGGGDAGTGGGR